MHIVDARLSHGRGSHFDGSRAEVTERGCVPQLHNVKISCGIDVLRRVAQEADRVLEHSS